MSEGNGLFDPKSLLGPVKRRFEIVPTDVGNVRIQSFTELQRSRIEASTKDKNGNSNANKALDLKCRLVVEAVVDADDRQVYTNSDIERLRQQDSRVINQLADAILKHCGFSDTDVEELEKNCAATATGN